MQSAANFFGKFYTIRLAARPFEAGLDKRWPTDATHRSHYLADLYNYSRPVFRDVGLSAYIENLRSISGIARVRNAATVHILQPTLATELVRRGAGVTRDERAIMTRPVPLGQLDAEALTLVFNQFMEEARTAFLAQASRDPLDVWLDYTDFFASVPDLTTVYYDRVHYLDARTEEIANRIAQDLAPVLSAGACRER
jgi:hypothetical protein